MNDLLNKDLELDRDIEKEKIGKELLEALKFDKPSLGLKSMLDDGRLEKVCPGIEECFRCEQKNPHHNETVGEHLFTALDSVSKETDDKVLLVATLLHDIGKPITKSTDENGIDHFIKHANESQLQADPILDGLGFSQEEKDKALFLIKYHDATLEKEKTVKKWLNQYGEEYMRDLCKIKKADINAQNPDYQYDEKMAKVEYIEKTLDDILNQRTD